ncbi:MAG: HD domain-containing protein [Acidobacteriota bacterium]
MLNIEKLKAYLIRHFEHTLVIGIVGMVVLITYFMNYTLVFLNIFYLPIIVAGDFLGKRMAVLTAVFCITIVTLFVILNTQSFLVAEIGRFYLILYLVIWSSFLILTSAALGYLYEENKKRIKDLEDAYIGVLEIMSKYLESADRYTQGHSVRVAKMSQEIAIAMNLSRNFVETVKAGALLHDIGKTEISMDIVNKAANLSSNEKEVMSSHSHKGAELLSLVGGVLKDAVPMVLAHHRYYFDPAKHSSGEVEQVPLGAAIIAVADAYDAMITDRPYRKGMQPWKAYEEIEKESGHQFHPEVVQAFNRVLHTHEEYFFEKDPVSAGSLA